MTDRREALAAADRAGRAFVAEVERLERLYGSENVSLKQAVVLARRARGAVVGAIAADKVGA